MGIIWRFDAHEENVIIIAEAFDHFGIRLVAIIPPDDNRDHFSRKGQWRVVGQGPNIPYEEVDEKIHKDIKEYGYVSRTKKRLGEPRVTSTESKGSASSNPPTIPPERRD